MALLAILIGLLFVCTGVLGLSAPDLLLATIKRYQTTDMTYVAAGARIVIGLVFLFAARDSRLPNFLRIVGTLILIGGLATVVLGLRGPAILVEWWDVFGAPYLREWCAVAVAVGAIVIYATVPQRTR